MNSFNQFNDLEINNFFKDIRFIGDENTKGAIKINGQNIKYQSKLLNIGDIAVLFGVNSEELTSWIKTHAKYFDTLFHKEELEIRLRNEEKYKEEYQKLKSKCGENKKELRDESTKLKKSLGLAEKFNSVVDSLKQPKFMDPRLIIPSIAFMNKDFNNWLTYVVIGGMCFDDKEVNICSFIEHFMKHKSESMTKIQKEFIKNKANNTEVNKNKQSKASTPKDNDKTMIIIIPASKTKLPYINIKLTNKINKEESNQETKEKSKDYIDQVHIGNCEKPLDYVEKYLKEKCKFTDDDVNKNGGMKLSLSNSFTKELYEKHKNEIVEYIKTSYQKFIDAKNLESTAKTGTSTKETKVEKLKPLSEDAENKTKKENKKETKTEDKKKTKQEDKKEMKSEDKKKSKKEIKQVIKPVSEDSEDDSISSDFGDSYENSESED